MGYGRSERGTRCDIPYTRALVHSCAGRDDFVAIGIQLGPNEFRASKGADARLIGGRSPNAHGAAGTTHRDPLTVGAECYRMNFGSARQNRSSRPLAREVPYASKAVFAAGYQPPPVRTKSQAVNASMVLETRDELSGARFPYPHDAF